MSEKLIGPLAYAVMHADSEFDYRLFAREEEAESFASECAVEENDIVPQIIPLVPDHADLVKRLTAAAEACDVVMDTAAMHGLFEILPPAYRDSWAAAHSALIAVLADLPPELRGKP